jgi:hypothetical protein
MLTLIRAGAFDAFRNPRPIQFWQARSLGFWPQDQCTLPLPSPNSQILPSPDQAVARGDSFYGIRFTIAEDHSGTPPHCLNSPPPIPGAS